MLYGVPGFLYIILELLSFYQPHALAEFEVNLINVVIQLVDLIITDGLRGYVHVSERGVHINHLPSDFRLAYLFCNSEYLGGAHGLAEAANKWQHTSHSLK
jgi:hypothetical protein